MQVLAQPDHLNPVSAVFKAFQKTLSTFTESTSHPGLILTRLAEALEQKGSETELTSRTSSNLRSFDDEKTDENLILRPQQQESDH